jgi:transcriptional regulator with GAF, ATPase, and Fis domain
MAISATVSLPGPTNVLVVSPDDFFRRQVIRDLQTESRFIEEAKGGADALSKLEGGRCRILLLDRRLGDLNPEELMNMVGARFPTVEIVPIDSQANQLETRSRKDATLKSADQGQEPATLGLPGLVGSSAAMQHVFSMVRRVAPRSTAVLLTGETGTGKEVIARAIHELSPRSSRPLVTVNCAAIPEALLESELFGHTRGAFTGAVQSRLGRVHAAQGGTLFLDEVGDMAPGLQAKLLRFLESGEVQRLGSSDVFRVDVRVIAATNANLTIRIAEKQFRDDLYYRLAVFPIEMPPLRDRAGDALLLARQFLQHFCGPNARFDPPAERWIAEQPWRGNVRELRHRVERASVLWDGEGELGLTEIRS